MSGNIVFQLGNPTSDLNLSEFIIYTTAEMINLNQNSNNNNNSTRIMIVRVHVSLVIEMCGYVYTVTHAPP